MKIQRLLLAVALIAIFSLSVSAQEREILTSFDQAELTKSHTLDIDFVMEPLADQYKSNLAGEEAVFFQASPENGEGWNTAFTPYLWIAGFSGDVVVRDVDVKDIDISFGDIIENLDMSFAGHLEATKDNKFTLLFDINYFNVSESREDVRVVRIKNTTAEFGATYHLSDAFEVLGGVRIVKYKLELTPRTGETFDDSKTFADGFAGIRATGRLGESFTVSGRGDIGGLSSDFSWNIVLDGSYRFANWGSFYLAYRWWEIDYGSNDDNDFQVNVLTQGPVLGLTFHF